MTSGVNKVSDLMRASLHLVEEGNRRQGDGLDEHRSLVGQHWGVCHHLTDVVNVSARRRAQQSAYHEINHVCITVIRSNYEN